MNFKMYRGDTPALDLAVVTQAGQPFNLTGWEIYLTAKAQPADPDPGVFQLEIGTGITVVNAGLGLVLIELRREDTANIDTGQTLLYDIQVSNDDLGKTHTVTRGQITIEQDITKAD